MRSKFTVCALVLSVFVSISGCTSPLQWWRNGAKVGPEYCRPHADVAPEWRDAGSPELNTTVSQDPCWWATFNDPVLNDLIATLHRQNLTLKTAAMRICEARAIRGVAVGNIFPQQQSFDGAYSRTEMSENTQFGSAGFLDLFSSDWTLGVGMAWELDFWGRFRRLVTSADANLESNIYTYDHAMVLLQAELAATYIQYRTLGERIRLAKHNVELQKKTVQIIQDRLDAGVSQELDLRQAKAQLFTTESAIPSLEAAHRKTENRICVLLGMPPMDMKETLGPNPNIPMPQPEVAVGIPAELLMRRPDVLAAERKLAAQSERIGVAESDLYPHISIVGQLGLESQEYENLFDWTSTTSKIMPGFKWDVLNYGRLLNNIKVEDARFKQALWDYRNTVLKANEEAENSLTSYLQEQVRWRKLAASVIETKKANELALLQYTEGVTDFQRVLDSQFGLVMRQDQLAESRGQVAVNLVMVYKALGGGWQCPCPGQPVPVEQVGHQPNQLLPTPAQSTPVQPTPVTPIPTPTPQVPVRMPMPQPLVPNTMPPLPAMTPQVPAMTPPQQVPNTIPPVSQPMPNSQPGASPQVPVSPSDLHPENQPLSDPASMLYSHPVAATMRARSQAMTIPTATFNSSRVMPMSYAPTSMMPPSGTTVRLPQVKYPALK